jgi:hypothetical protein
MISNGAMKKQGMRIGKSGENGDVMLPSYKGALWVL